MQVLVRCPKCDAALPVDASDAPEDHHAAVDAPGRFALEFSEPVRADQAVDRCPQCTGTDFYMRKDFDPKVGVAVVAIAAIISARDFSFSTAMPSRTACSRQPVCSISSSTGFSRTSPSAIGATRVPRTISRGRRSGFDLHTADVLEQEYERKIGRR